MKCLYFIKLIFHGDIQDGHHYSCTISESHWVSLLALAGLEYGPILKWKFLLQNWSYFDQICYGTKSKVFGVKNWIEELCNKANSLKNGPITRVVAILDIFKISIKLAILKREPQGNPKPIVKTTKSHLRFWRSSTCIGKSFRKEKTVIRLFKIIGP